MDDGEMREELSQVQDNLLTARAQTGDREAFGELYRRYLPPVLRFLTFRVASRNDAEDLAGLVFYRAWQALPRYREQEAGFRAWVYCIARNSVIDYYRTSRNHASLDESWAGAIMADSANDPDTHIVAEEVRAGLSRLPEEQQTVLVLRFVEGLSHAEVAEAVGKSEGACRMIQLRALKALARAMGEGR